MCGLTPHRRKGHPSCLSNVGERFRVIANDRLCRTCPFTVLSSHGLSSKDLFGQPDEPDIYYRAGTIALSLNYVVFRFYDRRQRRRRGS